MDNSKIYSDAEKMAAKAKPWTLKHEDKLYTATFDRTHWHYVVLEDGVFFMNLNSKSSRIAKSFLRHYLEN